MLGLSFLLGEGKQGRNASIPPPWTQARSRTCSKELLYDDIMLTAAIDIVGIESGSSLWRNSRQTIIASKTGYTSKVSKQIESDKP